MQLGHFGSKGSRSHPNEGLKYLSPEEGGWQTVSSSALAPFPGMSTPRALTVSEIQAIVVQFGQAAERAVAAGFDAIELHGVPTGAVGLITTPDAANAIIEQEKGDLVVIAREHLRDPYFATHAALILNQTPDGPFQYKRAYL